MHTNLDHLQLIMNRETSSGLWNFGPRPLNAFDEKIVHIKKLEWFRAFFKYSNEKNPLTLLFFLICCDFRQCDYTPMSKHTVRNHYLLAHFCLSGFHPCAVVVIMQTFILDKLWLLGIHCQQADDASCAYGDFSCSVVYVCIVKFFNCLCTYLGWRRRRRGEGGGGGGRRTGTLGDGAWIHTPCPCPQSLDHDVQFRSLNSVGTIQKI